MKHGNGLLAWAAMGWMTMSGGALMAQNFTPFGFLDSENITITLTVATQGSTASNDNGTASTAKDALAKPIAINNKAILALLGAPAGSKLVLLNGATLGYQQGNSDPVDSGVPIMFADPNVVLDRGSSSASDNTSASQSSFTGNYVTTVSIDLSGATTPITLSITGQAAELQKSSSDAGGDKTSTTHSFSVGGAGEGSYNGSPAIITGRILTSRTESGNSGS